MAFASAVGCQAAESQTNLTIPQRERRRALVVPREHGAWGMLLVPLATGAAVGLLAGGRVAPVLLLTGSKRDLGFAVRCDGAGQENYANGTPKRWWSDLVVLDNGQRVLRKQIVVNDPLVYRGIRFYQASYGKTGKIDRLVLTATPRDGRAPKDVTIGLDDTVSLDPDTTVHLAEFIPDYVVRDGQIYTRSSELENPAAHLVVESRKSHQATNFWLPAIPGFEQNESSPYSFEGKDLQMAYFTGLEVSHEPGQWSVWAGVLGDGSRPYGGFLFRPRASVGRAGARCPGPIDAVDWRNREQEQRCV